MASAMPDLRLLPQPKLVLMALTNRGMARLSWPGWLVTYRDSLLAWRRSPIQTLTGPSSSCVLWRTIVCMAQHRRTCLTACGRRQRSSLVYVSALLTPRHYKCRRLVGLP